MYVDKQNSTSNGTSNGHSQLSKERKPITVPQLLEMKQKEEKIVMLTAYDSSMAYQMEETGVDLILVGDSLGMVIQGHSSTLPVTVDDIVYHCKAVKQSLKSILLIADLPFQACLSVEDAVKASSRFLVEAGAAMVKLEGASQLTLDTIRALTMRSIPVCAHLGLTPQSVHALGGYRVQGKSDKMAEQIVKMSREVEEAGASLLVLECVPESLAERITKERKIPTIGIGAGKHCDGQVLVIHDILGITPGKRPKFVKNYLQGRDSVQAAIQAYIQEVHDGSFPAKEHTFH